MGGLAVGMAAKEMLSNFFGGLTIYLDQPFKVGDWINIPENKLEVQSNLLDGDKQLLEHLKKFQYMSLMPYLLLYQSKIHLE